MVKPLPQDNPELMARIQEAFGDELPTRIDQADGYYDWEDLMVKKSRLDPEVWSVEWVCNQPERSGLVYPQLSLEANVINEDNPRRQYRSPFKPNLFHPIYVFEDFGFGPNNPNVNLFCQVVQDDLVVFDELYNYGKISRDNMESAYSKLEHDYGVEVERAYESDGTVRYLTTNQEVYFIPDPAGQTEIEERKRAGIAVMEPVLDRKYYQLINGIPLVRKKIADRSLQIAPNCVNLIAELQSYRFTKNRDGKYTDTPEKKDDHGPDALRYGCLILFPVIAQAQFEPPRARAEDKPLTAGLMNKTF